MKDRKRKRTGKAWFVDARARNVPITTLVLEEKAKQFATATAKNYILLYSCVNSIISCVNSLLLVVSIISCVNCQNCIIIGFPHYRITLIIS